MYQGTAVNTYHELAQRKEKVSSQTGVRYITEDLIKKVSKQDHAETVTTLNLTLSKEGGKKIRYIENLEKLKKLQALNLSCNIIEKIERLDKLTRLRELNLSYNQISKIEGIDLLVNLQNLNLTGNQVEHIPIWLGKKLTALQVLRLAKNDIQSLQEFYKLRPLKNLTLLTVAENPVAKLRHCRLFLIFHLRTVDTLDGQSVTVHDRNNAHSRFAQEELETLEQQLEQQGEEYEQLQETHNKSMHEMEMKSRKAQEQLDKLKTQQERLRDVEQELHAKNDLLKRKTSELSKACEKHYELEQELAFYKIDHKFESLGKIQPTSNDTNGVEDGFVEESPYIGKGRFKKNHMAREGRIAMNKGSPGVQPNPLIQQAELETHMKKQAALDQELAEKQKSIGKAHEQLNHLHNELAKTGEQVQHAKLELQRIEDVNRAQALTEDDKQQVRSKLAKRINKIHHLRGEAQKIEQQMSWAQDQMQHQERGIGQLRGRLKRMGSKDSLYSTVKKEVSDKEQQLSMTQQEYQALQDKLEAMLRTIAHETGEIKKLERDLWEGQASANDEIREELEGIISGLQLYLEDIRVKAESQKDQMSDLLTEREEMMQKLQSLEKERHQLAWAQEELSRTQQRLAQLEESLEGERHLNTSLQHQLEETRLRELEENDVADRLHQTEDELETIRRKVAEAERRAEAQHEAYEQELEAERQRVEEAADRMQIETEQKEDEINNLHLRLGELQTTNTDLQNKMYRQQQHLKDMDRKKLNPEDLHQRLEDIISGIRSGQRGVKPHSKEDSVGHVLVDFEDQIQGEFDKSFHDVEKAHRAAAVAEAEAEALRKQLGRLEAEDVKRRKEDHVTQRQMEEDTRDLQVLMEEIARLRQELDREKKASKIPDHLLEATTPRSKTTTQSDSTSSSASSSSGESTSKTPSSFPSSQWSQRRRELYESMTPEEQELFDQLQKEIEELRKLLAKRDLDASVKKLHDTEKKASRLQDMISSRHSSLSRPSNGRGLDDRSTHHSKSERFGQRHNRPRARQTYPPDSSLESKYEDPRLQQVASDLARAHEEIESLHEILRDKDKLLHKEMKASDKTQNTVAVQETEIRDLHQILTEQRDKMQDLEEMLENLTDHLPDQYHEYDEQLHALNQGTSSVRSALQNQGPRIHNLGTPSRSRDGVYTERGGYPTARRGIPEEYEHEGMDYPDNHPDDHRGGVFTERGGYRTARRGFPEEYEHEGMDYPDNHPDDHRGGVFTERGGYPTAHRGFPEEYEHEGRDPFHPAEHFDHITNGQQTGRGRYRDQAPRAQVERHPHYPEEEYLEPHAFQPIARPPPVGRPVPTFYPPAPDALRQQPPSYGGLYQPQTGGVVGAPPMGPSYPQLTAPSQGAVIVGGHPSATLSAGFGGATPGGINLDPTAFGHVAPGGAAGTTTVTYVPAANTGNVPVTTANIPSGGAAIPVSNAPIQVPGGVLVPLSYPSSPDRARTQTAGFNSAPTTPVAGSGVGGMASVPTTPVGTMSQPVMVSTPVGGGVVKGILKKGGDMNDSEGLICTVPEHHDLEDYIAQLQSKIKTLKKERKAARSPHRQVRDEAQDNSQDGETGQKVLFEMDADRQERKTIRRLKAELDDRRSELEGLDLAIERQKASLEHMKESEKVLRAEREAAKKELKTLKESNKKEVKSSANSRDKKSRRTAFLNGNPNLDIFESDYEYEYDPHSSQTRQDYLLDEIDCLEETLAKRRAELREGNQLLHETEEDLLDARKEAKEMLQLYEDTKQGYRQTVADAEEIEVRVAEAGVQLVKTEEVLASMHTEVKEIEQLKQQQQDMLNDIEQVISAKDEEFKSLDSNIKHAAESFQKIQQDLAQADVQTQQRAQNDSKKLVGERSQELELVQQQISEQQTYQEVMDRELGKREAELKIIQDTIEKRHQQLDMLDKELEQEITKRRNDLQDIESHVQELREEKERLDVEIREASNKLEKVQGDLDHEEAVLQNLATTTNKHKSDLLHVDEELSLKQAALAQTQAHLSRMEALLESTDSVKLEEEREMKRIHSHHKTEMEHLRDSLGQSEEELEVVRGQKRTLEATLGAMHKERSSMEESQRVLEKRINQLKRLQGQQDEAVQSSQGRKEQLESELADLETEVDNIKKQRQSLKEELQGLRTQITEKSDELENVQDELKDAEDDLCSIQERVKSDQATLSRTQTELGALQARLETVSMETGLLQRDLERKKYSEERLEELDQQVKELEHKTELQEKEKDQMTQALEKSCSEMEKLQESTAQEQDEAREHIQQLNQQMSSLMQELSDHKQEMTQLREKYSSEVADLEGIAQAHYSRANRLADELNYLQAEFLNVQKQLESQQDLVQRERKLEDTLLRIKSDIRNEVSESIMDMERSRVDAVSELETLHSQKDSIEGHLDTLKNTLSVIRSNKYSDKVAIPPVSQSSGTDPFSQQQLYLKQQLWQKMQQHAAAMQSQRQLSAENLNKLNLQLSHLEQVMGNSDSGRMTATSVSNSCDEPLTTQDLTVPDRTSPKPKRAYSPNRHSQHRRRMGSMESLIPEKGPTS